MNDGNDKLTFKEKYGLKIQIDITEFRAECAGCGSHMIRLDTTTGLDELQELYKQLKTIKGIEK
jgi:hypothetical protein